MKIATVIGARPQFIKAATISRVIRDKTDINEVIIHTGQHYDTQMSDIFFQELDIPQPDYHLGIGGLSHGQMTGQQLEKIEGILLKEKPDVVLVYGDTNSTLAGALAAVKLHIPVAHVEAGLRSFNRQMPEEINRILTDHCASLLFAPTQIGVNNLTNEGIASNQIVLSGDVMYDAALFFSEKAEQGISQLKRYGVQSKQYILATIHRAENTDDSQRLASIMHGLFDVAKSMFVIFPLHPRTAKALDEINLLRQVKETLIVVEPLGYLDMVLFEKHSVVIVTDSGGVQKEACFHQVPCITVREETEWVELVDAGYNFLINPNKQSLLQEVKKVREMEINWDQYFYGNGHAASLIVKHLNKIKVEK